MQGTRTSKEVLVGRRRKLCGVGRAIAEWQALLELTAPGFVCET